MIEGQLLARRMLAEIDWIAQRAFSARSIVVWVNC